MQHTIRIDTNRNQFTVTTRGDGDAKGMISFLKDILEHPLWKAGRNILLDHRQLKIDKIKMDGIETISAFFKKIGPNLGNGKLALVMNRDIDFGIARALEILTADDVEMQIEVFRSIEVAQLWLDPKA